MLTASAKIPAARFRSSAAVVTAMVAALALAGCATTKGSATSSAASVRPKVVTVPELANLVQAGESVSMLYSRIQGSGTVYRLTTQQRMDLRADGMPVEILDQMQQTYLHAIQTNPELAKSDAQWKEIEGYWYGGLPFGWPREWVVGAPRPGEIFR